MFSFLSADTLVNKQSTCGWFQMPWRWCDAIVPICPCGCNTAHLLFNILFRENNCTSFIKILLKLVLMDLTYNTPALANVAITYGVVVFQHKQSEAGVNQLHERRSLEWNSVTPAESGSLSKTTTIESVNTTSMKNESTQVLCRKQSTIWDMKIRQTKIKYNHTVRH